MANQEQASPQQKMAENPVPFTHAKQVGFNLEDVILNTNNKVSLIYPWHSNKEVFLCVSDFISKCCIREAFTRSQIQYKEYLYEIWYSANSLDNSKVSFSIPTGGIYRVIGANTFRKAIGTHYLSYSSDYVDPPSIDIVRLWFLIIGYREELSAKGTLKKSLLPPREMVVLYTRFLSLIIIYKMKDGYGYGDVTIHPTQIFSVNNWALKPNQPEGPPFIAHMIEICNAKKLVAFKTPRTSSQTKKKVSQGTKPGAKVGHKKQLISSKQPLMSSSREIKYARMHKEDQQAAGGLTSLGVTCEEGAHPQLSSGTDSNVLADKTKSVSDELETVLTTPEIINVTQPSEEIKFGEIKLEDLVILVPNVNADFKDMDSPEDDPIIMVDDSEEDEEEDKNDEIHSTINDETKDISSSTPPSPSDSDDDETRHVLGSMVESSKKKELKKFDFITKDGEHIHLTEEQINQQKKIKEEYDRYCDKMLNRRVKSRITNFDILTRKGPVTLKLYREDYTSEIIPEFKASDSHLGKCREVVTACSNKKGKGWTSIYKQIQEIKDYLRTAKAELGIDLDRPLNEHDPLDRLNDLENKKRKHVDDIHDFLRANKRLKSSVQYEDHPTGTVLNEHVLDFIKVEGVMIMRGPSVPFCLLKLIRET
uniref:Uncharacterized protein n=1 Tax=Tanacetum cinerariifolium TaxID=118510 RepID=A0A6L2NCG4_TANCI|nr:hypothetical protein [Tanacetum cinerariifolium]